MECIRITSEFINSFVDLPSLLGWDFGKRLVGLFRKLKIRHAETYELFRVDRKAKLPKNGPNYLEQMYPEAAQRLHVR